MDKIIRTLICGGQISLAVMQTTNLVQSAVKIHKTSGDASRILGGLLTCGAYISSGLKNQAGSVSLTVKAAGEDGAVSVSADAAMHVRGYADGSCKNTLKGGGLTVVREDGYNAMPYVGNCEIESDDISDVLETYFGISEQIPTAVCIKTQFDDAGRCTFAGGVVMQLLPDAEEENIQIAGDAFNSYKAAQNIEDESADGVFKAYFSQLNCGERVEVYPEYRCNCSPKKIEGVLASVGKAELLKICEEQGEVKVHCHYCNTDYVFTRSDIEEKF